jgi:hypothetical protein
MKKNALVAFAAVAIAAGSLLAFAPVQSEKLDAKGLKTMLSSAGYEVKALNDKEGEELYEFKATAAPYDVFVSAQLSPSTNYVWLAVYFGEMAKREKKPDIYKKLLSENDKIKPCLFYVTEANALKMAMPIDNRGLQPADLKRTVEFLAKNVSETEDLWTEG